MADDQLRELQRLFAEAVLVGGPYQGERPLTTSLLARYPPPCWFMLNVPDIDACGGDLGPDHIEAAHWVKRQQVERWVKLQYGPYAEPAANLLAWQEAREELVALAAWDPRNAVPSCEHHHRNFDAHRVPLPALQIIVPRLLVPEHVIEFITDYGLETALEDKHPLEV